MEHMMVISMEDEALQADISKLQEEWLTKIDFVHVLLKEDELSNKMPLMMQFQSHIQPMQYIEFIYGVMVCIQKYYKDVEEDMEKLKYILTEEVALKWIEEAITANYIYFEQFAKMHSIKEWLPSFLAEHGIRPYLRMISQMHQIEVEQAMNKQSCPVCSEPVRMAKVQGNGEKDVVCPRCYASWIEQKKQCSQCGTDEEENLLYLKIEEDRFSQIQACQLCYGYVKLLDMRQIVGKQLMDILDLRTIHLDIVAQEHGYGMKKQGVH
jgi:FdhE protein